MSPTQWLFSFKGRIRRQDYWVGSILVGMTTFVVVESLALVLIGPQATSFGDRESGGLLPRYPNARIVSMLLQDALALWPTLALAIKRGHDRGLPAWSTGGALLSVLALEWVGVASPLWAAGMDEVLALRLMFAASLARLILSLFLMFVCGFLDGTEGPNRYGPSPKGHAGQAV